MDESLEEMLLDCDCKVGSHWYDFYPVIPRLLAEHPRRAEPGFAAEVYALHADQVLSWHLLYHARQNPDSIEYLTASWHAATNELKRLAAEAAPEPTPHRRSAPARILRRLRERLTSRAA